MEPIDYNSHDQVTDPLAGKEYAGFWWRLLALLIDGVLLWVIQFVISFGLGAAGFRVEATQEEMQEMTERFMADRDIFAFYGEIFSAQVPLMIITIIIRWLYFALMESSAKQGTLGKMALGITVTDMNGQRLTFLRATGRYFAKAISAIIIYIGYIMAGFTERKQGLHDMIAGTLVFKKQ
jgi:uncharacterized RDD family membrane protein YckC